MAGSGTAHLRDPAGVLLRVEDLTVGFTLPGGRWVHAVSGISFDLAPGETLGLVGESGCGKSTLARAIVQLIRPTSGRVIFEGRDLTRLPASELRAMRPRFQMIFQDPISSLNPRRTVAEIVAEPLRIWKGGSADSWRPVVDEVLADVGLDAARVRDARPHQLSGGQCQRVSIARALVLEPRLLVCDEPVTALDVSVQAQILNLLADLKQRHGLTMLFISHDLAVVRHVADRVAVMYLGKLCEIGRVDELYSAPAHPYTDGLLRAVPVPNPEVRPPNHLVGGDPPSAVDPPSGCRFRTRCPEARALCAEQEPVVRRLDASHSLACHFPLPRRYPAPEARAGTAGASTSG